MYLERKTYDMFYKGDVKNMKNKDISVENLKSNIISLKKKQRHIHVLVVTLLINMQECIFQ